MKTPIPESLESLLRMSVPWEGKQLETQLRLPQAGEVSPLIIDPDVRSPSLVETSLMVELEILMESLDRKPVGESEALSVVRSPEALAAVLGRRNELYYGVVEQGHAFPRCPHCASGEVELDLTFFGLALRLPPWDFFDRGVLMLPPNLASRPRHGQRPALLQCAATIRFELPSHRLRSIPGLSSSAAGEGELGRIQNEDAAWARWLPVGDDAEPYHWRRSNPGFRATLRLSTALRRLGADTEITPELIEALTITDFYFLDLLYHVTNNIDVVDAGRLLVRCPFCDRSFLPVL